MSCCRRSTRGTRRCCGPEEAAPDAGQVVLQYNTYYNIGSASVHRWVPNRWITGSALQFVGALATVTSHFFVFEPGTVEILFGIARISATIAGSSNLYINDVLQTNTAYNYTPLSPNALEFSHGSYAVSAGDRIAWTILGTIAPTNTSCYLKLVYS